jgi:hypothetical protein
MLDKLVQGMTLSANDFIANLKPLIENKKAQLAKSEFANIIQEIEEGPKLAVDPFQVIEES